MKNCSMVTLCALTLIFLVFMSSRFEFITAAGFTIDLIHRDSIESPSLLSTTQLVRNSLRRSFINRVNTLIHDHNVPYTDLFSDKGEYLMKISVGTPPVETLAIADTGSDLTWIQCKPCNHCFPQKAPLFEPNFSSTYNPVSCTSSLCDSALSRRTYCNFVKGTCRYTIGYGDMSYSNGYLATETITLGSVPISNVVIGCGHDNQGTFGAGASGIVGLGGGKTSLITQMGSTIQGRFSYCLGSYTRTPYAGKSKMSFGDEAIVSGDDVVTTPIAAKKTFYLLTLEEISVGKQRIDYNTPPNSNGSKEGNIIIDSGTTLTFLPKEVYNEAIAAVKRQMKKLKEMEDPKGLLSLCYHSTSVSMFPQIIFHFKGGADLKLKQENIMVKTRKDCQCLGFAEATSTMPIFGNLAQMNFLVGYDLENNLLSFKPTHCNKT